MTCVFGDAFLDPLEDGQAVAVRQLVIEQDEIDLGDRHPLERFGREPGLEDVILGSGRGARGATKRTSASSSTIRILAEGTPKYTDEQYRNRKRARRLEAGARSRTRSVAGRT